MKNIKSINEFWGAVIRRDMSSAVREEDGHWVKTSYGEDVLLKSDIDVESILDLLFDPADEFAVCLSRDSANHFFDVDEYQIDKGLYASFYKWDEKMSEYFDGCSKSDYESICKSAVEILKKIKDQIDFAPIRNGGDCVLVLADESTVYNWICDQDEYELDDDWADLWKDDFRSFFDYSDDIITWSYRNYAPIFSIPLNGDNIKNLKKYTEYANDFFKS